MMRSTASRFGGTNVVKNAHLKRFALTDEERENLTTALYRSPASPAKDFEGFRSWAFQVADDLPVGLQVLLRCIRDRTTPQPLLLVNNGPRDPSLPPAPSRAAAGTTKPTFVSEGFLTACADVLGEVFAFSAERNGRLIQDVTPVREHSRQRSSAGSSADLELHTEAAFHSLRPDFVLLACLRNPVDEGSPTVVSSTIETLAKLGAGDTGQLSRAAYRFAVPAAFVHPHERLLKEQRPILRKTAFGWDVCVNCNPGHTVAADALSAKSLRRLAAGLAAARLYIWLEPGDLLIIDNRRALHGRPAFRAQFSENGRWFQRVYVRANSPAARRERGYTRIITP
jgi:alpha-ketoglutarate-dependent taurine dioxygenase